jgi:hypothetical protein
MKPRRSTAADFAPPNPATIRAPEVPLNEGVAEAFREVEPPGFRDHPESSQEAAMVDPDVDDSEGGE